MEKGDKEYPKIALGLCEWKNGYLWYNGKIWLPEDEPTRTEAMRRNHDTLQSGHGGTAKTFELMQRTYYWPDMRHDIQRYVKNCDMCQRIKPSRHAPFGLLQPLEIPDKPWSSISMDFVTDLPESNGYDAIWVVVDRLTKMSHFVPCRKDMKTDQFVQLFMKNVFKLHGIPKDIVTDRGSIFTSDLWKEMTK